MWRPNRPTAPASGRRCPPRCRRGGSKPPRPRPRGGDRAVAAGYGAAGGAGGEGAAAPRAARARGRDAPPRLTGALRPRSRGAAGLWRRHGSPGGTGASASPCGRCRTTAARWPPDTGAARTWCSLAATLSLSLSPSLSLRRAASSRNPSLRHYVPSLPLSCGWASRVVGLASRASVR